MNKMTHCDKCGGEIVNSKCPCGVWIAKYSENPFLSIMEKSIEAFNFQYDQGNIHILSGDHHSGTCIAIFKGDYNKCMKVREYIESLEDKKLEI